MTARDIEAGVRTWVADETSQQAFTDDIGWAVYPTRVMQQTPQGTARFTHWDVELTIRTGLLGDAALIRNMITVPRSDPTEPMIRQAVAAGIEQLRQFRTQIRAPQNGHGTLIAGKR